MIKKLIKIYLFEKRVRKNVIAYFFSSLKENGFKKCTKRINITIEKIEEDYILNRSLNRKYANLRNRTLFLVMFVLTLLYFMEVKSELYESKSAVIVKDLSSPSTSGLELSLLGMGGGSQLQDSKVVEEYLLSQDFFLILDKKFDLIQHYKSDKIDLIERLSQTATLEESFEFYQSRTTIEYDEVSGILHIAYAHTAPLISKNIAEFMIHNVEKQLNELNKIRALKQLHFIQKEFKKQKIKMEKAFSALESYQNEHKILDPNNQALTESTIISSLEEKLTQKKIELSTLRGYLNENNYEIIKIKSEIQSIENSLKDKQHGLSGVKKHSLNRSLVDFEKLKMAVNFETEIYKNALIQLETTKLEVSKSAKILTIVSKPNMPDGYTYPDKPKTFFTIVIAYFLMYGIFTMLAAIIRDHKE